MLLLGNAYGKSHQNIKLLKLQIEDHFSFVSSLCLCDLVAIMALQNKLKIKNNLSNST